MIETFLRQVDADFPIALSAKQDLHAYAQKLHEKATLCCTCDSRRILSMAAGYTEHTPDNKGYIALVATVCDARGQGLAPRLVREFLSICREKELDAVHLYAVEQNLPAVRMYRELGFVRYLCPRDPRPDDLHLICYLKE